MAEPGIATPKTGRYVARDEALRIIGVKPATLYTYVSRGIVRSVPQPGSRESLYAVEDLVRLKDRAKARAEGAAAVATAMRWGAPVIETALTEITPDGPRYRGVLATDLARGGFGFEAVAEFLWGGEPLDGRITWPAGRLPHAEPPDLLLPELIAATLALEVEEGPRTGRIARGGTPSASARLLLACFAAVLHRRWRGEVDAVEAPIAERLAACVATPLRASAASALDSLLVLAADHELAPSTFAARVAASGGADLHACVLAALGVQAGPLVGRVAEVVERHLAEAGSAEGFVARAKALRDAGREVPGFDHPLYPEGDPRAVLVLGLAAALPGDPHPMTAMLDAARAAFGLQPRLETAAVVLAATLGLPAGAAGGLLTLARAAGWVAHVFEQRQAGYLIRPRARYVPPQR